MTFTKQEEDILKKMIEIQQKREEWNAMSADFQTQMRVVADAKRAELKTLTDSMTSKFSELQTAEAELKALVGA